MQPEQQLIGMDEVKSLEQEQSYTGTAHYGGSTASVSGIEVIIKNSSGQVVETIITGANGAYKTQPYSLDFEGSIEVNIPGSNPNSDKYFGHEDIPIGTGPWAVKQGGITIPTKLTAFKDSIQTYNIALPKRIWTSPKNRGSYNNRPSSY